MIAFNLFLEHKINYHERRDLIKRCRFSTFKASTIIGHIIHTVVFAAQSFCLLLAGKGRASHEVMPEKPQTRPSGSDCHMLVDRHSESDIALDTMASHILDNPTTAISRREASLPYYDEKLWKLEIAGVRSSVLQHHLLTTRQGEFETESSKYQLYSRRQRKRVGYDICFFGQLPDRGFEGPRTRFLPVTIHYKAHSRGEHRVQINYQFRLMIDQPKSSGSEYFTWQVRVLLYKARA